MIEFDRERERIERHEIVKERYRQKCERNRERGKDRLINTRG